ARVPSNARRFRRWLIEEGFRVPDGLTPIAPVLMKSEDEALSMARACDELGAFVVPVMFPAVAADSPRLRVTVTAAHGDDDLARGIEILVAAGRRTGVLS